MNNIIVKNSKLEEENVNNYIKNELKILKCNFSHIGVKYFLNVIYEVYKYKDFNVVNLSKDIYPIVGKKFKKDSNTIHSGLKRTINEIYYNCEENTVKEYFSFLNFEERPRLKEMIYKIILKVEQKK